MPDVCTMVPMRQTKVQPLQPEAVVLQLQPHAPRAHAAKPGAGDLALASRDHCAPGTLHVYDIGVLGKALNRVLRPLDLGVFHVGIEVYNLEWSFSETPDPLTGTGVFVCRPANCEGYLHVASLEVGTTAATEIEARRIIMRLEERWSGKSYCSLSHNCCHFCAELLRLLGAGSMPEWVTALASVADHIYRRKPHCCACLDDATGENDVVDIVEPLPLYSHNPLEQEVEIMGGGSIQWQPAPPVVPREGKRGPLTGI